MARCEGSNKWPSTFYFVAYRYAQLVSQYPMGECQGCGHAYSINVDGGVIKHSFHGCYTDIFAADCSRGQQIHRPGYTVVFEVSPEEMFAGFPGGPNRHDNAKPERNGREDAASVLA